MFTTRPSVLTQKKIIHGDKHFSCDQCNYSCTTIEYLKKHKMSHTGEKPFACDQCNRSFKLKPGLERHEGIIQKCVDCGKTFTQAGSMDVHKRVYHEGLLFGCDYCSHKARRKS